MLPCFKNSFCQDLAFKAEKIHAKIMERPYYRDFLLINLIFIVVIIFIISKKNLE